MTATGRSGARHALAALTLACATGALAAAPAVGAPAESYLVASSAAGAPPQAAGVLRTAEQDGRWYIPAMGVEEIHQSTTRGEGITVAVFDSGFNPSVPDLATANLEVHEPSYCSAEQDGPAEPAATTDGEARHGTGMAALIAGTGTGDGSHPGILGVAPGASVRAYRITIDEQCPTPAGAVEGRDEAVFAQAIADGADIINISLIAASIPPDVIASALRAGVIVVAGVGNEATAVSWPAAANGVVAVRAGDVNGEVDSTNASGPEVAVVAPGVGINTYGPTFEYGISDGSSNATAITSGALALAWSAHPDATANQILQSLVRNTGQQEHELSHNDEYGYGFLNLRRLVAADPTAYPDVNPLVTDTPGRLPEAASITGAGPAPGESAEPGDDEPATTAPDPGADTGSGSVATTLLLVAGVAALVVLVVVVVVVVRRRGRAAQAAAPGASAASGGTGSARPQGDAQSESERPVGGPHGW